MLNWQTGAAKGCSDGVCRHGVGFASPAQLGRVFLKEGLPAPAVWGCWNDPGGCKPQGSSGEEPGAGFQAAPLKLMASPELQWLNGCLNIL